MGSTEGAVEVSVGVPEAARRLGISTRTVWRLIAEGDLRVARVGNRTLVPRIELDAFILKRMADT